MRTLLIGSSVSRESGARRLSVERWGLPTNVAVLVQEFCRLVGADLRIAKHHPRQRAGRRSGVLHGSGYGAEAPQPMLGLEGHQLWTHDPTQPLGSSEQLHVVWAVDARDQQQ